jgi:decaprenyl-phosphate phosphoribosyltransferase
MFTIILKTLRAKDWIKNILILFPVFFSGNLLNIDQLEIVLKTVLGFSLVASSIYIINDLFDEKNDKNHEFKKFRPIAAGLISKNFSILILIFSLLFGLTIQFYISLTSFFILTFYFILNVLYSYVLKHIPIIDFFVVSIGFVLRVIIGGIVVNIEISNWIILMALLISIFITACKRRDDVYLFEKYNTINRPVVVHYTLEFMDKIISISSTLLIMSYILFITSDEIQARYNFYYLLITFVLVFVGILRYNQITYVFKKSGSPIRLLFSDIFLQICVITWIVIFLLIIYGNKIV